MLSPALRDLTAIYASDPEAVPVACAADGRTYRTCGFLTLGGSMSAADELQIPAGTALLRVIAGSVGQPEPDAPLVIAGRAYRLLAEAVPTGDGHEQTLHVTPVTAR